MGELAEVIEETQARFSEIAPSFMKYDTEKGFAIQILSNNSYLRGVAEKCPKSLQQAITNIAAIGLSLNPAEKLAYLIPRTISFKDKGGKKRFESRVFLEPSYMGLCKLATDSGSIDWVQARCVYENDEFIDNGLGEKPTHKYNAFSKDRGKFVGVYCVAKTDKGDYLTSIMDEDKVLDIRGRSESWKSRPNSGVWKTDFEEQAKKTVVRNAYKMWPRTNTRLSEAVNISNENMGFEKLETTEPSTSEISAVQKSYFDELIETSSALEMYVLKRSLIKDDRNVSVWTNLVHSFPKGKKGYYGDIVKDLTTRGESIYLDISNALADAIGSEDEMAIKELLSELSQDCVSMLVDELSPELAHAYRQLSKAAL